MKIFETINNRWKRLDSDCDNIGYDVERIFKIYSYQIRGQRGIKSSEIGLRDFSKKQNIPHLNIKNIMKLWMTYLIYLKQSNFSIQPKELKVD